MIPPLAFAWDGEALAPCHPKIADRHLVVGERYTFVEHQNRSMASHGHYFAALHDAWLNLPEDQAERFATEEHLRKWCLIRSGYHDQRSIVAASKAEAQRIAAFIKPLDDFAVVTVSEAVVTVYTAKSQSMRAMGAKEFNKSKQDVLELLAGMIGVKTAALEQSAGRAA